MQVQGRGPKKENRPVRVLSRVVGMDHGRFGYVVLVRCGCAWMNFKVMVD